MLDAETRSQRWRQRWRLSCPRVTREITVTYIEVILAVVSSFFLIFHCCIGGCIRWWGNGRGTESHLLGCSMPLGHHGRSDGVPKHDWRRRAGGAPPWATGWANAVELFFRGILRSSLLPQSRVMQPHGPSCLCLNCAHACTCMHMDRHKYTSQLDVHSSSLPSASSSSGDLMRMSHAWC